MVDPVEDLASSIDEGMSIVSADDASLYEGKDHTPKPPSKAPATPKLGPSTDRDKARKNRSGKSKRRHIRFKKTVGIHSIPNLQTYTTNEKLRTWFQGLEGWTTEGEQRKESHVQLAIDIVWQAQLDQWKASSDINECWEFIRQRYLRVSQPCHQLAHKMGKNDEDEVQGYLAGVKSVEKNRRRMMKKSRSGGAGRKIRRSSSEFSPTKPPSGRRLLSPGQGPKSPLGRSHSMGSPRKGVLKTTSPQVYYDSEDGSSSAPTPRSSGRGTVGGSVRSDDDSTVASSRSKKKISYQPKSKSKVPVSPVGSVMSSADSDATSVSRRMRSHMSVCSEDSTRRRMLRTVGIKEL